MGRFLAAPLLLALVATAGLAESYRFDMGSAESPVARGYTRVTPEMLLQSHPECGRSLDSCRSYQLRLEAAGKQ